MSVGVYWTKKSILVVALIADTKSEDGVDVVAGELGEVTGAGDASRGTKGGSSGLDEGRGRSLGMIG